MTGRLYATPRLIAIALAITVLSVGAVALPQTASGPALSAAESAAIRRKIAALHSSADRGVAGSWSDAKKVAEVLCRPSALPVLRKSMPGVDRVFLGTDDPSTLTLESNRMLKGSGTARTPQGWSDFTFTCELDPETAKVMSFQPIMVPAKSSAPSQH